MIPEMLKVCQNGVPPFRNHHLHHLTFVVRLCFPFDDFNRPFGAMANACTKTIAEQIADQPCFAIDKLHGSLVTIRNANAASVAFFFINLYNFSLHIL